MYGIFLIRSVSVGLDSQIWYLFIYITGYLNVRKISETIDFRTFVGPLVVRICNKTCLLTFNWSFDVPVPCLKFLSPKSEHDSQELHDNLAVVREVALVEVVGHVQEVVVGVLGVEKPVLTAAFLGVAATGVGRAWSGIPGLVNSILCIQLAFYNQDRVKR